MASSPSSSSSMHTPAALWAASAFGLGGHRVMCCCLLVPGRGRLPHRCQWQLVGGRCGLTPIPLFPVLWQPGLEASQAGPVPLCKRCACVKSLARLLQRARSLTAKRKPAKTSLGWHGPRGEEGDGPSCAHSQLQIKLPPPHCCHPGPWCLSSSCSTAWMVTAPRKGQGGRRTSPILSVYGGQPAPRVTRAPALPCLAALDRADLGDPS